jgi:hypothetical protein
MNGPPRVKKVTVADSCKHVAANSERNSLQSRIGSAARFRGTFLAHHFSTELGLVNPMNDLQGFFLYFITLRGV